LIAGAAIGRRKASTNDHQNIEIAPSTRVDDPSDSGGIRLDRNTSRGGRKRRDRGSRHGTCQPTVGNQRTMTSHGQMFGVLIALAAVATLTAAATPAHADNGVDSALNASGTADASSTGGSVSPSLGSSICTAITEPGQTMTSIASALAAQNGTSPRMSKLLIALSVSAYCPTMMTSLPGDDWLRLVGNAGP
jgi:hypothetical protein